MVDILMATYNGSEYIRGQILSLQQQTYGDWNLFIRDDESTDDTVSIIKDMAKNEPRIKLVSDDLGNIGPGRCFLELTKYSSAEFAIFCDQDDIWFEKKIENLLIFAKGKLDKEMPGLVYCDGYGYDSDKGVITLSSISRAHAKNLNEFLFFNAGYQGCSMFFNRKLCQLSKDYEADFYMHDDIVSLIAHTFGRVYFLDEQLMLYRQHANNVTGNIKFGLKSFVGRVLNRNGYVISRKHYDEKKNFYNFYLNRLTKEQNELFSSYLSFPHVSLWARTRIIFKNDFSEGGERLKLVVKTILRKPIG